MSLWFFDKIFFFEAVILNIMTSLAQVSDHPFDSSGAATEALCDFINGTETVLLD
jgi:hypothetical protein